MATSNEYSKLAEKCFRLARETKTETDRLSCLDLAQKWLEASLRPNRGDFGADGRDAKIGAFGKAQARTATTSSSIGMAAAAVRVFPPGSITLLIPWRARRCRSSFMVSNEGSDCQFPWHHYRSGAR